MLASSGLHATRSSFIASLNCKSARQESFRYADRQASAVDLFNKLSWIPFYEQSRIDKCSIIYKRINGTLLSYLSNYILTLSSICCKRSSVKHLIRHSRLINMHSLLRTYGRAVTDPDLQIRGWGVAGGGGVS